MSLWFVGDSYCIETSAQNDTHWKYEYNWMDLVAQGLEESDVHYLSQFGVSNDWIFKQCIDHTADFKEGDTVIVQLTGSNRKWFFPDEPQLSNTFQSQGYHHSIQTAVDHYHQYLHNDQLNNIQYTAYVYALMFVKQSMQHVNFLFLPGFDSIPNVNGNLTTNICNYELGITTPQEFFEKHKGYDPRLNHMSIENHTILANKVVDCLKNNTPLDLTNGFVKDLY